MVAENSTYDPIIKHILSDHLLESLRMPIWTSPEWRAWFDRWREAVPLTPEQERDNAEWRARLGDARRAVQDAVAALASNLEQIEREYRVKVVDNGEGGSEFDVDEYEPPHRPTYRTKDGAPPAPPMWPTEGKTIRFVRFEDKPAETQKGGQE